MNVQELMEKARDTMTVRRVYGEPIEKDGVTIIPAASVSGGGGGGGFGVRARPVGAFVIKDGQVRFEPAVDASRLGMAGIALTFAMLWTLRAWIRSRRG
ncbi:MAG TPA: hypothetical protein VET65_01070 [Candidatus Limnocylindrales bacterium]|nr:hypothetical protein [Candidatus Limnocylindrales bacterium]